MFWKKDKKIETRGSNNVPQNGDVVTVNVIDSTGGLTSEDILYGNLLKENYFYSEKWTIGSRVSLESYLQFRDPMTKELYLLVVMRNGTKQGVFMSKNKWEEAKRQLKTVL